MNDRQLSPRAVVVMGKLPRPGRVKTRLAKGLSPAAAADLYRGFMADTFRLVDRVAEPDWRRVFACALQPTDRIEEAAALVPPGWTVEAQQGEGLGARIEHARSLGAAERVLVMGSDSPTLPEVRLVEAFEALTSSPVVVVPTDDGGYALIGFDGPHPELLTEIPWSTEAVMKSTRAAAQEAGLRLVELAAAYDVDHVEDLERLRRDLDPQRHPATVDALAQLR